MITTNTMIVVQPKNNNQIIVEDCQLLNLDHDSLELIFSFCPNRASYEIQSMKYCCKYYYNLFTLEDNLANPSEIIQNESLLNRIGRVYLPRLCFQIFIVHNHRNRNGDVYETYWEAMKKVFRNFEVSQLSMNELEVEVNLEGSASSEFFNSLEEIVDTSRAVRWKDLATLSNNKAKDGKLHYIYLTKKNEDEILKNHVTLQELYNNWNASHYMDKKKVNPFRLCKRMILHLQLSTTYPNAFDMNTNRESSLYVYDRVHRLIHQKKIFKDVIELEQGFITQDYKKVYYFECNSVCKLLVYYLFRHKIIPRMDSSLIDLKEIYGKETIKYMKTTNQENFMIYRENIIEKYRNAFINGQVKFSPQLLKGKMSCKVNGLILPLFLNLVSIETMNIEQRLKFFKQFLKHIYGSKLDLSNSIRTDLYNKYGIEIKHNIFTSSQTNNLISLNFESIYFKRESAKVFQHMFQFPAFPTSSIGNCKEEKTEKLKILTKVGLFDKYYTSKFCMSKLFCCCNVLGIVSCWCATSCCCYETNPETDMKQEINEYLCGCWACSGLSLFCCYQHKILPMLDCENLCNQLSSILNGVNDYRYITMYGEDH